MLTAAIALLAALASVLPAAGPERAATLVHVTDGTTGGVLAAIDSGTVTLREDGREQAIPLDSVREIIFGTSEAPRIPPPFTVWDTGGNMLAVRAVEQGDARATLDLTGYGWAARGVPLTALRAIAPRRLLAGGGEALSAFERARADSTRTRDVVIATAEGGVQTVACVVEGVSAEGVRVSVAGRDRTADWDRCAGVVLSGAAGTAAPIRRHVILLLDGSVIEADSFALADGLLTARLGPAEYSVQCAKLARIRVAEGSYAYLSDLPVESVEAEPQLDVVWPHRLDASVAGGPLVLDGTGYAKGIGMHPITRLTFRNTGAWDRVLAVVGVDDAAADRGSVRFVVLADGRQVADTGPLTGADAARKIDADVAGAELVTLAVEPGDPFALGGNLADWCDARLVRAPQRPAAARPGAPAAR
jgi:hypothetical protein